MWVCLRVKEGQYPPPPPKPAEQKSLPRRFKSEVALYVRECFSHKYYLLVFVMLMMAAVTYGPVNIFSLPYAASLDISMHEYGKALATTYFVSLCLSFFLGWLADLFHPLRMAMATLLGYAVVTFCGGIFAGTKEAFLVTFVLHGILSGCYFTSAASLAQRLFPREKFAQFASAAGIFISIAGMAVAPVTGTWIDLSGNQYRLCFVAACILSLIALGVSWMVYKRFKALGGPKNYSAPEV